MSNTLSSLVWRFVEENHWLKVVYKKYYDEDNDDLGDSVLGVNSSGVLTEYMGNYHDLLTWCDLEDYYLLFIVDKGDEYAVDKIFDCKTKQIIKK